MERKVHTYMQLHPAICSGQKVGKPRSSRFSTIRILAHECDPQPRPGARNLRPIAKATLVADRVKPPQPNRVTFLDSFWTKDQEDSVNKAFRFLAMCVISTAFATLSTAWGQTYKTIDFPGATATLLIGGPNPQGTSVGY